MKRRLPFVLVLLSCAALAVAVVHGGFLPVGESGVEAPRLLDSELWFVGGDALACWAYCLPMLVLLRLVQRG
jgi:hypothetical protein